MDFAKFLELSLSNSSQSPIVTGGRVNMPGGYLEFQPLHKITVSIAQHNHDDGRSIDVVSVVDGDSHRVIGEVHQPSTGQTLNQILAIALRAAADRLYPTVNSAAVARTDSLYPDGYSPFVAPNGRKQ